MPKIIKIHGHEEIRYKKQWRTKKNTLPRSKCTYSPT